MAIKAAFFRDVNFQDQLVALLVKDQVTLNRCAHLLTADDFKPTAGIQNGKARWIIAERALNHFEKYREPIKRMLRSTIIGYAEDLQLGTTEVRSLEIYVRQIIKTKTTNPEALVDKVANYKVQRLRASLIEEMIELQSSGTLTDDGWEDVLKRGRFQGGEQKTIDYFSDEELQARLVRRTLQKSTNQRPVFLIEPLDQLVRSVGPGHIGLVLAPPKRGKSLFLQWLSVALTIQAYNVLHVTLEDPQQDVEDRLDAMLSGIPYSLIGQNPKRFQKRWQTFRRMIEAQLHIVDGTQQVMRVSDIESAILRKRDQGICIDALVVDYDNELRPQRKHRERRFEFAEIYDSLRRLAANFKIPVWTASQTKRGTEDLKIIGPKWVSEDIGKIQKCHMCLSLGKGDLGEEGIYIWVNAHRSDDMNVGCNIVSNKSKMLIYDRNATWKAQLEAMDDKQEY